MYFIIMSLFINSPTFSSRPTLFILTHTCAHANSCSQMQCIANTKFLSEAETQSQALFLTSNLPTAENRFNEIVVQCLFHAAIISEIPGITRLRLQDCVSLSE